MMNQKEIFETNEMIEKENLDVRTITMGISLFDCASEDPVAFGQKIYDKICRRAENLVNVGNEIGREFGIPIINKRVSVTPIALAAGNCRREEDYIQIARMLDRAAHTVGVDFIGGYSALVSKHMTGADPAGAFANRAGLFLCQCRFDQNGNQYGCGPASRETGKENCRADSPKRLDWLL